MMKDKTYDNLKTFALIAAPVLVFLSTLLNIWNVPHTAEITASLAALDTLIGAIVTAAKQKYDEKMFP